MKSAIACFARWLVIALTAIGCSTIKEPISNRQQAIDDLNAQHYDEAVALLEPLYAASPNDAELRFLLASAYSGAVHFNVIDSFDAFAPLLFQGVDGEKTQALALDAGSPVATTGATEASMINDIEKASLHFLGELNADYRTLANIPLIPL